MKPYREDKHNPMDEGLSVEEADGALFGVPDIPDSGRMVAALCGSVKHARKHKEAGIDIIVCNGTEGGGHTGKVGSIVLWRFLNKCLP